MMQEHRTMPEAAYELQQQAKRYNRAKYILALVAFFIGLGYILFMLFYGTFHLKRLALATFQVRWLMIAVYLLLFTTIYDLLTLPLSFYSGFILEKRFQLSTESLWAWIKKEVKKALLSFILFLPLVELTYLFLDKLPGHWWFLAAGIWILFTIIFAKLAPVLILPLFYKTSPLEDEALEKRLTHLAQGTGLKIENVERIEVSKETKKPNAALVGSGRTRRILLTDTLLKSFSGEEIAAVLAHELGHHILGHLWKFLVLGSVATIMGFSLADYLLRMGVPHFGFQGLSDIANFPLLLLVLIGFGLLLLPLQNAISRRFEARSDRYAINKTQDPLVFISTMEKLARLSLADRSPNRLIEFLFHDHPPIRERIKMAKEWQG